MYHKAAREGNTLLLKQVTRHDCKQRDDLGQTPLHIAASVGNIDSMVILLSRGSKIDRMDYFGSTSLHVAAGRGLLHAVKYLIEFGANPLALDNNQRSAIDEAYLAGHTGIVDYIDKSIACKTEKMMRKHQKKAVKAHTKSLKENLKRDVKSSLIQMKPRASTLSSEYKTGNASKKVTKVRFRTESDKLRSRSLSNLTSTDSFIDGGSPTITRSAPGTVMFKTKSGSTADLPSVAKKHEGLFNRSGFGELSSQYRPHYIKYLQYADSRRWGHMRHKSEQYPNKTESYDEETFSVVRVLNQTEDNQEQIYYDESNPLCPRVDNFLQSHDLCSLRDFFIREKITLEDLDYIERTDLESSGVSTITINKFFKAVAIHNIQRLHCRGKAKSASYDTLQITSTPHQKSGPYTVSNEYLETNWSDNMDASAALVSLGLSIKPDEDYDMPMLSCKDKQPFNTSLDLDEPHNSSEDVNSTLLINGSDENTSL